MLRRRTADDVHQPGDTVAALNAARAALQRERAALAIERRAATAAAEAAADAAAALAAVVARCEKAGVARRPDGEAALLELCGVAPRQERPSRRRGGSVMPPPAMTAVAPPPPAPLTLPRPESADRWLACFGGGKSI